MPPRLVLLPMTGALVVACSTACSGADGVKVSVRGTFGTRPQVSFPGGAPGRGLAVTTLAGGGRGGAARGDLVVADYVGYRWGAGDHGLLTDTFGTGRPAAFPTGSLVPGLERAFAGAVPGSRRVARIPPEAAFGRGRSGDTLVYVLDVRAVYRRSATVAGRQTPLDDPKLPKVDATAPRAPTVTVPRTPPPNRLEFRALVRGSGPAIRHGQLVALQYVGARWRDGTVFHSSWARGGRPHAATVGTGQLLKGWDQALVGQRVGTRLLLVVPPSLAHSQGAAARPGTRTDDTLVFVIDILGAH
jgi:FKBP-type peptidyl-prolyl cis-trans isomerase